MARTFSFEDAATRASTIFRRSATRVPATVVAGALSAKVVDFPYVVYKACSHRPDVPLAVIRHIRSRRIKVRSDSKLGKDTLAAYYDDTFWLNDSALTSGMNMSLTLVHEATHAILDLQRRHSFAAKTKLIAYLAEALCSFRRVP